MPDIDEQEQGEASLRFDEAQRAMGTLLPEVPLLSKLNKAKLALGLGVSPLPIAAVAALLWPDNGMVTFGFIFVSCIAATGAMIIGSSLGGRLAPLLAARLGYLFGLGWLSLWVLGAILLVVADAIL